MRVMSNGWPWPPIKTEDCKRVEGGYHTACVFCAPYQFSIVIKQWRRTDGTSPAQMPADLKRLVELMKEDALIN